MKKLILLFSFILTISSLQAVQSPTQSIQVDRIYEVEFEEKIRIEEFMQMDLKQIEKKSGKKLKFKEKIALKMAQRRMKQLKKKGASQSKMAEEATEDFFDFIAFLLGLFLWPLGVLIVHLIWDDRRKTRAAWLGTAISTVLFILLLILLINLDLGY